MINYQIHRKWAREIFESLHNGFGLDDVPMLDEKSVKDSYPVEMIAVVAMGINLMFRDRDLAKVFMVTYEIHSDIITQVEIYAYA